MDELQRVVSNWATDARHADAITSRNATFWQRQQRLDELNLGAVLVSMIESTARLTLDFGRLVVGRLTEVGDDFCIVETNRTHLVALAAIESLESDHPWRKVASGQDEPISGTLMNRAEILAAQRTRLTAYGSSGRSISGELVAVGQNVIVLDRPGPPKATLVMPIHQVSELSYSSVLRDSG